jgi:arsenical pump membrane protein
MLDQILVLAFFMISSLATVYLFASKRNFGFMIFGKRIMIEGYYVGPLIGPVLLFISGLVKPQALIMLFSDTGNINPFGILVLFFSMVFISIYLDHVGLIEYCARLALKVSGDSGTLLFLSFYFMVSMLTIFTSNDIIILTVTPFIYYFTKHAGVNPKPYLIAEFFAANTWSMMLYIGNPTDIFVSNAYNIQFFEYLKWMFLPTVAGGILNLLLLYFIFRKEINRKILPQKLINPIEAINDRAGARVGLAIMVICLIGLSLAPYLGIKMWVVSLACAAILLAVIAARSAYSGDKTLALLAKKMPWSVILFILSFFISVDALESYGITDAAGQLIHAAAGNSPVAHTFLYGFLSVIFSNVLNNIPMSVAFTAIMKTLSGMSLFAAALATIIGSNLGANITPIGALAGIMWMSILEQKNCRVTFLEFVKYGLLTTILVLVVTLGVLAWEISVW